MLGTVNVKTQTLCPSPLRRHRSRKPCHLWANVATYDRGRLKYDGTRAETRFRLSTKRTCPFKSAGASVQSITGSWGVRISGSNAWYTMFRGSVKGTGYPLHSPVSPSLPLPCVTVCHRISTESRADSIIGRMRAAYWISNAKDTHSECVVLIAFPRQQWSRERVPPGSIGHTSGLAVKTCI